MAVIATAAALGAAGLVSAPAQSKQPVAIVAGQPIYEEDLLPAIQGQLRQIQSQEFQVKKNALENLIRQRVLESEAKKKGLTVEKLLEQEVDEKVPAPSEDELRGFYLAERSRLGRPFEEIKPQISNALKQMKTQEARENYIKRLREEAEVIVSLAPPRTLEIGLDPARLRGDTAAPVTIVEFSDFQCPYCRREEAVLKAVLQKYQGKVRLAYRDFPLEEIHPQAEGAAEAARCAGEQGKFWEYHDSLFTDPPKLTNDGLIAQAESLGLNRQQFATCLSSGKFKPEVAADKSAGARAGVTGTPGFFINGIFLEGAEPAEAFEKVIDTELASRPTTPVQPLTPTPNHP